MNGYQSDITNCPSDNPFRCTNVVKKQKINPSEKIRTNQFNDDVFIKQLVKRDTSRKVTPKKCSTMNIYRKVKIVSKNVLEGKRVEYFKFPFNTNIKKDDSDLYNLVYMEWLLAITSVYKNYKNKNEEFYVKFFDKMFIFSTALYCSSACKEILEQLEVEYLNEGSFLKVSGIDVALVYDYVINYEFKPKDKLPFILSKHKFTNSISYDSKFVENQLVRDRGVLKHYYVIEGYLYGHDFSEYFEEDVAVEF
ncbi:hypothetical protein THOM_2515 [Trachipleistophora hominis]|uniref:Uncharacterized protein n=1 Tax=Trachipleistophora hominis TaxID=72359 RepID=L7JU80_TRAHO|nr:hypothetical protein THOM_2515 [Trachipleistophora hominis]